MASLERAKREVEPTEIATYTYVYIHDGRIFGLKTNILSAGLFAKKSRRKDDRCVLCG